MYKHIILLSRSYCPPPNRKLPPVPGQHSNYNTIDRIKNGNILMFLSKLLWELGRWTGERENARMDGRVAIQ